MKEREKTSYLNVTSMLIDVSPQSFFCTAYTKKEQNIIALETVTICNNNQTYDLNLFGFVNFSRKKKLLEETIIASTDRQ